MSLSVDRRRDGTTRGQRDTLRNPTCETCGRPCFSFGWPMYATSIDVCGVHATGPAADWYAKRRAADA